MWEDLEDAATRLRERIELWASELSWRAEQTVQGVAWTVDDLKMGASIKADEIREFLENAGERLASLWERAKESLSRGLEALKERLEDAPERLVRYGAVAGAVTLAAVGASDPEISQAASQIVAQGLEAAWQHTRDFVSGLPEAGQEAAKEWQSIREAFAMGFAEAVETAQSYWEKFKGIVAGLKEMGVGEVLREAGEDLKESLSKTASQVRLEALEESRQILREVPLKGDLEPF